ncbi:alkaline phosphatase III (plasmid) [Sinorhizobium americanum CCGM7]|uniref:alkaline phosphatase n=1 Tax=Sinorhizobium americanum TaxID=194963 RepID=UPI0004D832F6|nr:alkaline phosphatase [Sinorhizobium americanum]APG87504.1 alkaline phosphatase III [Sinorhizobium americanum CCGM7]
MIRTLFSGVCCAALMAAHVSAADLPQASDSYFTAAKAALEAKLAVQPISGKAKNIIIFVGDGMSVATVTAARILEGQKRGVDGESNVLTIDTFPYTAMSKTYSHDGQVSDSAPTATAMVAGVKTRNDIIGLNQDAVVGDCEASKGKEVKSIFELAEEAGLATGVVSTARITHATPAATYGHTPDRDWENDKEVGENIAKGCKDLADQLVNWTAGDGFEVILGGGRSNFVPAETADVEDEGKTGSRTDKRDLTAEWTSKSNSHLYVTDKAGFDAADLSSGAKLLGLFDRSHMEYELDRPKDAKGEPSLAEMTAKSIERLSQGEKGFVLMVEGGRIDHAHHAGNAARALEDAIAFDQAIKKALEMTKREDTLIVATADHGHTMTINGYPKRGNPLFGLVVDVDGQVAKAADGKPYTTIGYANGPGAVFPALEKGKTEAQPAGARPDLSAVDTQSPDFLQPALVPMESETHAGDDVVIYAWGPQAHLFSGTVEENYIYHVLSNASGLGQQD